MFTHEGNGKPGVRVARQRGFVLNLCRVGGFPERLTALARWFLYCAETILDRRRSVKLFPKTFSIFILANCVDFVFSLRHKPAHAFTV